MLKDNGVLICPTWCRTACFPQTMLWEAHCSVYTILANITGAPSTQIPMGFDKDGIPLGFQVINEFQTSDFLTCFFHVHFFMIHSIIVFQVMSASYQDHLCLAVAREFEKNNCVWVPPS